MTRRELWDIIKKAALEAYDECEAGAAASLISEELYGLSKVDIFLDPQCTVPADVLQERDPSAVAKRLSESYPVQYIIGYTSFCCRRFNVREGVLIPRPETEALVRWIEKDISEAGRNTCREIGDREIDAGDTKGEVNVLRILDIGTGSGCIAVTLAAELQRSGVTAVDISEKALEVARENAELNGVVINFERIDILESMPEGPFDIIVSNPPYVRESEKEFMEDNVLLYEPELALFVKDDDPLIFYRSIARKGLSALAKGGRLYFEINEAFARETLALLVGEGYKGVELGNDLFGKPRMVKAWLN